MSDSSASPTALWRRVLRGLAVVLAVGTVGFWAMRGAHRGWSQDRVPVKQTDEITGIEFTTYEERFVPGIDTLAAGLALAAVVAGASFLPRRRAPQVA